MTRSRSRKVVALLDCCYSGAIARGLQFRAGAEVDVEDHLGGHGRVVITASSAMEYAFEGDELSGEGKPSVFTTAVVRGLESGEADRDQDRLISVDDLYDYVCEQVREVTPNQRPNMLSHLEGALYIARSSYVAPVTPAPLPAPLVAAIENPLAGVRGGRGRRAARSARARRRGHRRRRASCADDARPATTAGGSPQRRAAALEPPVARRGPARPAAAPRAEPVAEPQAERTDLQPAEPAAASPDAQAVADRRRKPAADADRASAPTCSRPSPPLGRNAQAGTVVDRKPAAERARAGGAATRSPLSSCRCWAGSAWRAWLRSPGRWSYSAGPRSR